MTPRIDLPVEAPSGAKDAPQSGDVEGAGVTDGGAVEFTPGPMRLVTAVEISAQAAARWRAQYAHWADDDTFADGSTKGETVAALNRIRHTPENISRVLNLTWSHPVCECCDLPRERVVQFHSWDDKSWMLCEQCLTQAGTMIMDPTAQSQERTEPSSTPGEQSSSGLSRVTTVNT